MIVTPLETEKTRARKCAVIHAEDLSGLPAGNALRLSGEPDLCLHRSMARISTQDQRPARTLTQPVSDQCTHCVGHLRVIYHITPKKTAR